jgi:hypothetical protein
VKTLLAAIIGAWADLLTAWQKTVFAVVYDTCLIAVMIGIEVLGHVARPVTHAASPTIDAVPAPTKAVEAPAIEVPVSLLPKPRLVAQEKARTKGVALYLAERLQPKRGARVELEECQVDYAASGLRPLTTKEFVESLQHFCSACRIKTRVIGDEVYLLDVQLAPLRGREAS